MSLGLINPNTTAPCTICNLMHVITQKCSYDVLVTMIYTQRGEQRNLINMNKELSKKNLELYEVATNFQNVIKHCEAELSRLYPLEARYKKREHAGAKKLPTEAPEKQSS